MAAPVFNGNIVGNVTGNLTGNVSGNVSGASTLAVATTATALSQLRVSPSGDTAGNTDTANVKNQIAAVSSAGQTLVFAPGTYYLQAGVIKMNQPVILFFDNCTINVVGYTAVNTGLFLCDSSTTAIPFYAVMGKATINANGCGVVFDGQNITGGDSLLKIDGHIEIASCSSVAVRTSSATAAQNVEIRGLRVTGYTNGGRTTLSTAITTTGSQTISCAGTLTALNGGATVRLGAGTANQEDVAVTSVSGSTFVASPTKTHAQGDSVSYMSNQGISLAQSQGRIILEDIVLTNCGNGYSQYPAFEITQAGSAIVSMRDFTNAGYAAVFLQSVHGRCEMVNCTSTASDSPGGSIGGADGFDWQDCYDVSGANLHAYNCAAVGICPQNGSTGQTLKNVTLTACIANNNGGAGFGIGGFIGTEKAIQLTGCTAYNNGQSNPGNALDASGFEVVCNDVQITGCRAYDDQTVKTQTYGIGEKGTTASSTCFYQGNVLNGNKTGALNISGSATGYSRAYNNPGYNPVGYITAWPGVPASGTAQTNVYSSPVDVTVTAGTATITQIAKNGHNLNITSGPVHLDVGETITLTYSGGTPTWVWMEQ